MRDVRSDMVLAISRRGLKDLKILLQVLVQLHNGSHIATTVIVIRRRPNRYKFLVEHVLVPFHDQLMGPGYQSEPVVMAEAFDCITTE